MMGIVEAVAGTQNRKVPGSTVNKSQGLPQEPPVQAASRIPGSYPVGPGRLSPLHSIKQRQG